MVQTIATLIDETLMVMGAHLHVRMTDEEKAYLDAHFELIHIKKGEHLVTRGEEVCYLYYLESGIVRLWFPDKENREISARFIQAKEFINFFLSHEEQRTPCPLQYQGIGAMQDLEIAQKRSSSAI